MIRPCARILSKESLSPKRWKELVGRGGNIGDTIDFHSDHQLLVLSHSPRHYTELGRLVANAKRIRMERLQRTYLEIMMDGLKLLATVKKNTRVLHHVMGYFDGHLHPDQKKELMETINGYHKGSFPLIVPITLLKYYVRACNQSHLARQYYLNRDLVEPQLGNHA